jgi:predicted dehydrogenase
MTRVAVIGCGAFGSNHARVLASLGALAGVFDADSARAREVAARHDCPIFPSLEEASSAADAAVIAVPTRAHADIGCALLERGLDILVEKPIAATLPEADALVDAAEKHGRILQVGHLERFNPAVQAAQAIVTRPLFFEVHRMSVFSPRSLDVDVVLDLMIHDLDIVLALAGGDPKAEIEEIRAVGLAVLSKHVDIANVRLVLTSGCVANFTASRVSTEKIRKLRFFQPGQYVSVDYARQDAMVFSVEAGEQEGQPGIPNIGFRRLETSAAPGSLEAEPLRAELRHFLESVATRNAPLVDGRAARRALDAALRVIAEIEAHGRRLGLG